MLQGADGGFALHGGKILKKLVQSLPPFEVIQQGLEGNASPAEHRGPSKNIGVSHDDAVGRRHSRISPSVYSSQLRKTNPSRRKGWGTSRLSPHFPVTVAPVTPPFAECHRKSC
jgi:hypothetical protein